MMGSNSNGKLGLADEEHQQPMQIYLSKPAGQREGPFTVEQINRDLASKKYKDTDYWAWYDGLAQWIPLHAVPGVLAPGRPAPASATAATMTPQAPQTRKTPEPVQKPKPAAQSEAEEIEPLFKRAPAGAKPAAMRPAEEAPVENLFTRKPAATPQAAEAEPAPSAAASSDRAPKGEVSSGLPFAALEQIFIFTTGDGRGVLQSPVVSGMLQDVVGVDLATIRTRVGRDIIGNCDFGERVRRDGAIPEAAWRAMASLKPEVVRLAREGTYRACIRTFTTGAKEVVALFLFYNKQKM